MNVKLVLLIIDMQKGFMDEKVYPGFASSAGHIIPSLRRMVDLARQKQIPVVHTAAIMGQCTAPLFSRAREFSRMASNEDTEVIDELKPAPTDHVVEKCRYNGFHATNLEILLRNLGTNTLLVGGVATEVCVESTVRGAIDRDFKVIVLEDCTATTNEEAKEISLRNMRNMGRGIEVKSSIEVIEGLS